MIRRSGFAGMPLVFTLASRNLFHDRLRFVATTIGIVFSVVLVMVQMGLYLGFGQMVTTMIDHASADLWIMPKGTKCFEDPSLLDTRQRSRALSIPGARRGDPGGDRLCRLAVAERIVDAGLRGRLGFARGRARALESDRGPCRIAFHSERRRGRRFLQRAARHIGGGCAGRNPPAERAGRGGDRGHPLVHHDALRVHGRRPGAGAHRRAVEQGHLFPGACREGRRRRAGPPQSPGQA